MPWEYSRSTSLDVDECLHQNTINRLQSDIAFAITARHLSPGLILSSSRQGVTPKAHASWRNFRTTRLSALL